MNSTTSALQDILDRIPRRHSSDNVKEINAIISEYESVLMTIESVNEYYEKNTPAFFEDLEKAKLGIKKSNDNKASKKQKDDFFSDASGDLKESIIALIELYGEGDKVG